MKNILLLLIVSFLTVGCGVSTSESSYCNTNTAECQDAINAIDLSYQDFCAREDSAICTQYPNGNTISNGEALSVFLTLRDNFTLMPDIEQYSSDDYWHANESVDLGLLGDQEDKCITYINHLVYNGVDPSLIELIAAGIGSDVKHYYVRINGTAYNIDTQYKDIFYMNMGEVGVWIL